MNMRIMKNYLIFFSSASGAYRGLLQVPFHLGILLALTKTGMDSSEAFTLMLTWVFGAPRLFSTILEISGGIISHKLGTLGTFKTLPWSQGLRATVLIFFAIACISESKEAILLIASGAVFIGEIGRSLLSGSYEDARKQTIEYFNEKNIKEGLIASTDVYSKNITLWVRTLFAITGTYLTFYSFLYDNPYYLISIFLLASFVHLISSLSSFKWSRWAFENLNNSKHRDDVGNLYTQTKVFFFSNDILWCIGTGSFYFFQVLVVTLAAISLNEIAASLLKTKGNSQLIFTTIALAGLSPFSALIGNFFFPKKKEKETLQGLDSFKGPLFMMIWGTIGISLYTNGPWLTLSVPIMITLSVLWSPIDTWVQWMRNPILEEKKEQTQNKDTFGQSHVFYYSLIAGTRESTMGLLSFIFFQLDTEKPTFSTLALIASASFLLLIYWTTRRERIQV